MLWIAATLIAVVAQTVRNAMQSSLTQSLGTLGATQVRFLYGLPFALLFLLAVTAFTGAAPPAPNVRFLAYTFVAALAQIGGTAFLLAAMQARSFSVGIALSKTEAVQIALFGLIILGDALTPLKLLAIVVATLGVVLTAVRKGQAWDAKPALYGVLSGALYAIAAVGFRGATLELGEGAAFMRATTTLVWSLSVQTLVLGAWLWAFQRAAFMGVLTLWRPSLLAGFTGALASQFWFFGFALTTAANVRTLGLVEVLVALAVSRRVFAQNVSARELAGVALIVAGVAMLLAFEL